MEKKDTDKEKKPFITKKIDHTTYEVHVEFSKSSKETMDDKIVRLMEREANEHKRKISP